MFADDTIKLNCNWRDFFENEYKLAVELQNVKIWLDANKLTLNEEKTKYMLIGSLKGLKQVKNDPIIKIRSRSYDQSGLQEKVLGLEIDDKLQ
jgi:uncharacterized protein VirK/YbjX